MGPIPLEVEDSRFRCVEHHAIAVDENVQRRAIGRLELCALSGVDDGEKPQSVCRYNQRHQPDNGQDAHALGASTERRPGTQPRDGPQTQCWPRM